MALPLSQDLRARLVRAVAEGSSLRQAAARFQVSPSSAIKLMQRVRATGSTAPAKMGGYRRPLLDGHEALLRELTAAKPGITLVEIKRALAERGIEGGPISTIWTTLRRLGLSHPKVAEGRRTGPSGCRPHPSPLAGVAAVHGSRALRVPGRDRCHPEHDAPLRLGAKERAPGRRHSLGALADDDVCRRPAG